MRNNVDQPRDSHGRWTSNGSIGRQPVQSHANTPSVHTRLSAKAEKIALGKAQDEKRYPSRTDQEVAAMTDLGKPTPSYSTKQSRFPYQN